MTCIVQTLSILLVFSFVAVSFRTNHGRASGLSARHCSMELLGASGSCEDEARAWGAGTVRSVFAGVLLSLSTLMGGDMRVDAKEQWTDNNRLAADTWRAVDELYFDRSFNGQDWFKLRQEVVKKSYKTEEEVYKSIKDMLAKLGDKYTRYLTPAQYSALMNSATGELTGLGIELETQAGTSSTVVVRTEDGSPAQQAGVLRGDVVVNMDGTPADALSPEEVAALARGRLDSKATMRVQRGGELVDFTIIRKPIKIQGVTSGQFKAEGLGARLGGTRGNDQVGFIKIRSFTTSTRDEVMHALEGLHSKNRDRPLDALVIDLRGNGGGSLQGAIETSSLLLNPGKIVVFVVGKDGNELGRQTLPSSVPSADPDLPDTRTPLYVLVDQETASAAEVFAAALQENDRARLVGARTFGKGIIQNLQELRRGGVAVTVNKYETPRHNDINKVGIPVDLPLLCDKAVSTEECLAKLGAAE